MKLNQGEIVFTSEENAIFWKVMELLSEIRDVFGDELGKNTAIALQSLEHALSCFYLGTDVDVSRSIRMEWLRRAADHPAKQVPEPENSGNDIPF